MKRIDCFVRKNNNQVNISSSQLVQILLKVIGTFFMGSAIIAIFLPFLPTTPFLLLAATCYGRSSAEFPHWLSDNRFLNNKWFGTYIKNYLEGKGIPLKIKILSLLVLAIAVGCSTNFIVPTFIGRLLLVIIALGISLHVLFFIPTLKSED